MSYPPPPGGPNSARPHAQAGPAPHPGGPPAGPPAGPFGAPGNAGAPPAPHGTPQGWPVHQQQPPAGAPGGGDGDGGGKGLRRAVVGVVVLAFLAALGVGGLAISKAVGGDALPGAAGDASGEELLGNDELSELLDGRTEALEKGDEDAFLAPFSGKAEEKQRGIFRNLRKISFTTAEYRVLKKTGTGNNDYGDGATVALDVAFVHQIEDVDVRPVAEWYRWIVKRESADAEPQVTKVGGSPSAYGSKGYVYYPAPWDVYDDMHVQRQEHTITISDRKNAADARRFAPHIEQAAEDDLRLWKTAAPAGAETPTGFVVVLEPDRKRYAELYTSDTEDVGWDAGQAVPMPSFDDSAGNADEKQLQFGGSRIKMDSSTSRFTSSQWQRGVKEISRHEMAHAVIQPLDQGKYTLIAMDGGPRTWMVEGFANYVAYRFDPQLGPQRIRVNVTGKEFDGKLPSNDFSLQGTRTISMNYTLSYLAVRFVAEEYGEDAAFDLVTDHYQDPRKLEQQLQDATGMGESEFEKAWADYVRSVS